MIITNEKHSLKRLDDGVVVFPRLFDTGGGDVGISAPWMQQDAQTGEHLGIAGIVIRFTLPGIPG